jgi:uncharacterized protein YodC (DUF2158 family)
MSEFRIGDTVRLKSGGPTMTVTSVLPLGGSRLFECAWFEGEKAHSERFPAGALEAHDGTPSVA